MNYLRLSLLLFAFAAFAQQDQDRPRVGAIEPIIDPLITVDVGESQTIPGPSALAVLQAIVGVTGGSTNGVVTSWTYTEGPFFAEFEKQQGPTNLATFTTVGRYTITVVAQKGSLYNTNSLYIYVLNQNITNFNPTVSMTRPANGSEFTAPLNLLLTADAQDKDGTVTNVVFYNGTTALWTSTVAPYSFTITNADPGNYVFAAAATDNRGATNLSTSVSTIIRTNPVVPAMTSPLVSVSTPTNAAVFTAPIAFNLTASVSDVDGAIVNVTFSDNDVVLAVITPGDLEVDPESGQVAPYAVSVSPSVGTHVYRVTALDNDGLQTTAGATITVLNPPNILPTVTLTAPANGATFTAPADVTMTATASDSDGTITQVRFFSNGVFQGFDSTSPYSFDLVDLGTGTYALYAQAVDDDTGTKNSATNTITVNPPPGVPPVVAMTSPTEDQSFAFGVPITLTATATDDGTVTNVIFYRVVLSDPDPEFPATVQSETVITNDTSSPYTQSWTPATQNSYVLIAKAWDNAGLVSTSTPPITITVNQPIPPVVQLTSPTNNSVFAEGSNIAMTATATDQDGTVTNVVFMQFQPDVFLSEDQTSPYTGTWTNAPAGSYSLVAKAYDSSGLTTISTAVHVSITPTPPATVVVDAGAFSTATLSPYKTYFDTEYTANAASFNALAASGTGANYYNLQFVVDANVSMYEGTRETNYINRALLWCETMVSKATIIDNNGDRNWSGVWASPYTATPIAYQLEEFQGACSMSRTVRVIMADPDLRALFGSRATVVYTFLRDHIVNKHLVTRSGYSGYANWSQNTTSSTSDKPSILLRLILDLKAVSAILGNSDTSTYSWASYATELAEGIKDYNGQEERFLPWQYPGALVWAHGKNWQGYTDLDTSHANRLPFVVVQGYEMGQTFTVAHVTGLAELLHKVLWDGSTSSPMVRNFLDGSNGTFLNRPAWNNGKTYDGFYMLGAYSTNVQNFNKYTALAVKNGVSNPTLSYQNSTFGRSAMSGHIARNEAILGIAPYAVLNGTVTGSGTTGTNWTHVSGPSGWTIVKPTSPKTTVLFTSAAVGSHIFRLTITSSGPTVSDDVGVTVLAAPAFGTIGGGTAPPPPEPPPTSTTTNEFLYRLVFYRTGNLGLSTTAQYNRLTNVVRRAYAKGYNGLVLEEPNMKSLSPNGTALANLTAINNLGDSLGVKIIPYTFGFGEPQSTSPIELREAFPVIGTKFVRSGGTATAVGDPVPVMLNGGFESFSGNQPTSWDVDDPGVYTFMDTVERHSGLASVRIHNPRLSPNKGRVSQNITVTPWRAYKMEVWVKTASFTSPSSVKFYVTGNNNTRILWTNRDAGMGSAAVAGTQTWSRYEADINSMENSSIRVWVSCASTATGDVWFDDFSFVEIGLNGMVRRATTPIIVTGLAGVPTYTEGSDYVVATESLTIPVGSTIPAGASLRVNWYQLASMAENSNIPTTACVETFWDIMGTNFSLVNTRMAVPDGVMARYNENRVAGHDPSCPAGTTGFYLSNVVARTETLINSINPTAQKFIWNDQWGLYHNATTPFYVMSESSAQRAWDGVSTNWVVINWQSTAMANELNFWAGRDATFPIPQHQQILGSFETVATMNAWLDTLAIVEAQGLRGVVGMCFVSWINGSDGLAGNYTPLEAVADACIARNRWPNNPFP